MRPLNMQNVVELLDDLFQRAAAADEPDEQNYVRKHARSLSAQGVANGAARLFSNPAGDYGAWGLHGTGMWHAVAQCSARVVYATQHMPPLPALRPLP